MLTNVFYKEFTSMILVRKLPGYIELTTKLCLNAISAYV